jgi:hypothetical protein
MVSSSGSSIALQSLRQPSGNVQGWRLVGIAVLFRAGIEIIQKAAACGRSDVDKMSNPFLPGQPATTCRCFGLG